MSERYIITEIYRCAMDSDTMVQLMLEEEEARRLEEETAEMMRTVALLRPDIGKELDRLADSIQDIKGE
ncbi:hypothetical protein CKO15_09850 [Halorhodospira abdelmalekii]|nr:hypothetical protein [Halorhodospira abdelmalekii]